jgi:hypothetical protein
MNVKSDPYPHSGGPRKIPSAQSLFYVTGSKKEGVARFREWLRRAKHWSEEQIDIFLASRADHYPPVHSDEMRNLLSSAWIHYPELWPLVEPILSHPAANSLLAAYGVNDYSGTWLDYGGFLADELPALRSAYRAWKYGENSAHWRHNLYGADAKKGKAKIIKIRKS